MLRSAHHLGPAELFDQGLVGDRVQPPGRHQTADDAQRRTTDEIQCAVDPARRGRPDPVRHTVAVRHRRRAEPGEQVVLGWARGADDGEPTQPGELHQRHTDPATRAVHQERAPRLEPQVLQGVVGRAGGDRQDGGLLR